MRKIFNLLFLVIGGLVIATWMRTSLAAILLKVAATSPVVILALLAHLLSALALAAMAAHILRIHPVSKVWTPPGSVSETNPSGGTASKSRKAVFFAWTIAALELVFAFSILCRLAWAIQTQRLAPGQY